MRKKLFSIIWCCVLLFAIWTTDAKADDITVRLQHDGYTYVGGIFDMYAYISEGGDRASYQWQVDVSMEGAGSWHDLKDSEGDYGYHGTNTDHFQFVTYAQDGSYEIGTGWEKVEFRCKITLDGKTYYTESAPMRIESYKTFEVHLDMGEFGINTRSYDGVWNRTGNGKINYGEAYAGQELHFVVSCYQTEGITTFQRSELRFVPEIWITENGKVRRAEGECYYTPSTIGKDAVVVEYKIHMYMGINDLGIYDSEKMIITTREQDPVSKAYAKHDMHLLKEMYTQSQKLTSISKGSELAILENIGGTWYKVSHNGYVGYVPATSVEFCQKIAYVSTSIDEPDVGNAPNLNVKVNGTGYDQYYTEPVMWYNKTTGKFMKHGEKFVEGHHYQVTIWLAADDGYEFDVYEGDPSLQATLNGHAPEVRKAYEQDPSEVVELFYDFGVLVKEHICTPQYVKPVEPTCTEPGFEGYYHCKCGKSFADGREEQPVNLATWGLIPATGHTVGDWKYNGTHHYRKCASCLAIIPGTTAPHSGGKATCVEKAICQVCGGEYGEYEKHIYASEWTVLADEGHVHMCTVKDCPAHDTIFPHNPGPEATESTPQICKDCGYILIPVKNHTHSLTRVDFTYATCTQAGNREYYICSGCSEWFQDSDGKYRIENKEDVVLPPMGHSDSDGDGTCDECSMRLKESGSTEVQDGGPVIVLHPQNANYPEYSVASYTVKAIGENLSAIWYMEYEGVVYEISDYTNGIEPWEGYAGASYGAMQEDANTFVFFFGGIGAALNGAKLWCVVEDGHYDTVSQQAIISVGNPYLPPVIEEFPAFLTVEQGEEIWLQCKALAPGDSTLRYIWYETSTGKLQDIYAISEGDAENNTWNCDTSKLGIRYYCCRVDSSEGGFSYSNVVPVKVVEKKAVVPETSTEKKEDAVTTVASENDVEETESKITELETNENRDPIWEDPKDNNSTGKISSGVILLIVAIAGMGMGVAFLLGKRSKR